MGMAYPDEPPPPIPQKSKGELAWEEWCKSIEAKEKVEVVGKVQFPLEENSDAELTCVCCRGWWCEYAIKVKGDGQTTWSGIHRRCVAKHLVEWKCT